MRKGKRFNRRQPKDLSKEAKKDGKIKVNLKWKTNVICFSCNRKVYFKANNLELKDLEQKKNIKKALKATCDKSSSSESSNGEKIERMTKHLALIVIEDALGNSNNNSSEDYGEEVSLDDEVISFSKCHSVIICLNKSLEKSEQRISHQNLSLKC